ncbi:MAG: F0F1 ATP synthase subunit delta [Lachnospiraceae bacterium]|nr:F0F1 ATP synthase subunit delta [Lachnospiraceae bacterium]
MAKLVTGTYANALFETGTEMQTLDTLYEEVSTVREILNDNPDFSRLMNHPKILKEEKERIVEEVFKGRVSDELTGFLKLIVSNKRYAQLMPILEHFVLMVKEYKKIGIAYVVTPMELSESQKEAVRKKLLDTTDYETMEMNYKIDESLIGGMIIRIGDKVVDSSIKTKLEGLKRELGNIQLSKAKV